ncbi:MAG: hypothetical protein Q8K64_02620 [Sediminibacterium sp.]|nr:hypothetical protein [Sediminibacterium sp.]
MRIFKFYFTFLLLIPIVAVRAQDGTDMPPIPAMRQLHHEYIIRSLSQIDSIKAIASTLNLNELAWCKNRITQLRVAIEKNEQLNNNDKYKWLRGVNEILIGFISGVQSKTISPQLYKVLISAYDECILLDWSGNSIEPIILKETIETGLIIVDNFALSSNIGLQASKDLLVLKQCSKTPNRVLPILTKSPRNRYADSLIVAAGFRDPEELYSYAAAPNALGKKIQSVNHPFVQLISRLALMRTGRMYFPFLDNLYTGLTSIDAITPYVVPDSSLGYYKLLVKTRIQYAERMQKRDTPIAAKMLTDKLKSKAIEDFINEINGLHAERSDLKRFKKLQGLSPIELYYLAVLGEEEMYTSSFVSGIYPRIFERMDIPRSDSLLMLVKYDYYKKFLKITAAYNMLDDFLNRMDRRDAEQLIKGFVNGLEKTNTLEDAVDVADSYAGINNPNLRKLIHNQVQYELRRCNDIGSKRGMIMYHLLNTLFVSLDSINTVDLSAKLGIPPVYELGFKDLQDTITGRIIMQQFFYGDKDGAVVFNAFLNKFRNPNWRIIKKSQWVEVSAVKGAPITIYANLPLDENQELDELAQDSLIAYLADNNLHPTIVIHRGHSYYVNQTIKKIPTSAKLVLLGSCGGFQKMNDVLQICPGAQIIASKQVGTGIINQGLINVISEQLRLAKNLNWPILWNSLAIRFNGTAKEKFDDYMPPHKNLGAIFITAYNNQNLEN